MLTVSNNTSITIILFLFVLVGIQQAKETFERGSIVHRNVWVLSRLLFTCSKIPLAVCALLLEVSGANVRLRPLFLCLCDVILAVIITAVCVDFAGCKASLFQILLGRLGDGGRSS